MRSAVSRYGLCAFQIASILFEVTRGQTLVGIHTHFYSLLRISGFFVKGSFCLQGFSDSRVIFAESRFEKGYLLIVKFLCFIKKLLLGVLPCQKLIRLDERNGGRPVVVFDRSD